MLAPRGGGGAARSGGGKGRGRARIEGMENFLSLCGDSPGFSNVVVSEVGMLTFLHSFSFSYSTSLML
jgi:hypothetical protein